MTANVFDIMADLDDIKGVIPEGLYLNISNLLKAEYTRQSKSASQTQPVVNNITLNIQSLNISVPTQTVIAPVQEPEEPQQVWRVYDNSDGLWGHILIGRDGEYLPELQGEYDDVEYNLRDVINAYISTLPWDEAKYFVERYGVAQAIKMHNQFHGTTDYDDDEELYKGLLYLIIEEGLMIHDSEPARPRF